MPDRNVGVKCNVADGQNDACARGKMEIGTLRGRRMVSGTMKIFVAIRGGSG